MVRLTSLLVAACAAVTATAAPLQSRIVYTPKITYPHKGVEWTAGEKAHVSWNSKGIPDQKNLTGTVRLGHRSKKSEGEHLCTSLPLTLCERHTDMFLPATVLAKDFPLGSGNVSFTLPHNITERHDYIVVLFGDSGNSSPEFTINAA